MYKYSGKITLLIPFHQTFLLDPVTFTFIWIALSHNITYLFKAALQKMHANDQRWLFQCNVHMTERYSSKIIQIMGLAMLISYTRSMLRQWLLCFPSLIPPLFWSYFGQDFLNRWPYVHANVTPVLLFPVFLWCSVCDPGHVYSSSDGYSPWLDVFLLFCGHVHVLLCPLADVCFWNTALWHVSENLPFNHNSWLLYFTFSTQRFRLGNTIHF